MALKPMSIGSKIVKSPAIRPMLNISPLFDAMTGNYADGVRGEKILNGGLMSFVAFVGEGNTSKSTIMNSIAVRILARHLSASASTMDTEGNFQASRMLGLAEQYPELDNEDFLSGEGRYSLTSSIEMDGEVWFDVLKKFCAEKQKTKDQLGTTPFRDNSILDKVIALKFHYPTLNLLDSMSEFQTGEMREKMEKNDIDDKALNMYYAQDALQKAKMIGEFPKFLPRSGSFVITTAHVDDKLNTGVTPERKKLVYMRQGQKIKRVPSNFTFLTQHCWEIISAKPLYNSDRSDVYYPSVATKESSAKNDIYEIVFHGLRNKSGLSGVPVALIVSQSTGVLFDLSHFHFLKELNIGIKKSGHGWTIDLYPDELLLRTTVRDKLVENRKLARAVELTCEIAMLYLYHASWPTQYRISFEDIYTRIKELGYNWDELLDTRGYWLYKEEEEETQAKPYLSGFDLIRMCLNEYQPYWMKK